VAGVLGTIRGEVILDVRKAVAAYATLRAQNARTMYALRGTGDAMVYAGQRMGIAGLAMVYAFGKAVSAAAEFERKMDYFGAVTDTSAGKMQKLSKFTLQLAQDTIYSANEIADGMIELGKAGVSAEQIMGGIGKAMANLGAAGDIPLAESGQIITSTIQQFDLKARDAVKVVDLLAGAANASIADITDIGVSLKYVGGVANASGLKFEDTATAISLLAKAGIRGSTAGTSLRQMIVSFGGATGPATEALKALNIITEDGSNKFYDQEGNLKSLSKVYQILQDSTADLTNKQRLAYLRTIFNNRALSAAAILTRDGAKGFKEMNREMSKVTAAEVASARLDNLSGDIEILKGNIETLLVTAGGPFQEMLRGWVQDLTKLIQKFNELDPETQKNIVAFIGIAGVVLTAMGAFTLLVGSVFRFIVASKRLIMGLKFIWKVGRVLWVVIRLLALALAGTLSAAAAVVIAVLAALAIAFVIAYKKSEAFRNFVNGLGKWFMDNVVKPMGVGLKLIVEWFKLLIKDPKKAWEQLKTASKVALDLLVGFFKALPGRVWGALKKLPGLIGKLVSLMGQAFGKLIGKLGGLAAQLAQKVLSYLTWQNVLKAALFLVTLLPRLFLSLIGKILPLVGRLVAGVFRFFQSLPGKVGYALGFLIGRVVALMARLSVAMISKTVQMIGKVIGFFAKLPGRVIAFVTKMVTRVAVAIAGFVTRIPAMISELVSNVVNFFSELPEKVGRWIQVMVAKGKAIVQRLPGIFMRAATDVSTKFINGILGLPGTVQNILGDVIQAFKDVVKQAFNAAKDFAKGLWDGFKDGIGMHSPSHIERAAWQINGVLDVETKKMAKKTMDVQRLSKTWARTSFKAGDESFSDRDYSKLARMQAANQKRAGTLASASLGRPSLAERITERNNASRPSGHKIVSGELDLSPNGRAYLRGIAEEVYGDNDSFADSLGGMDGY
jgi:TP901 family phage tail tape measure protein